ncbi:MAG: transposase [Deltaproteobacteria bacterium]|nr:transposase [Deltaproteobacteria bacterium]
MKKEDMMKAMKRYELILKIKQGVVSLTEAAVMLGVSLRHMRRLRQRGKKVTALLRRPRGWAWNAVGDRERQEILHLRREPYRNYNLLHFRDVLRDRHGIDRSREFYRRLFLSEKLYTSVVRKRKPKHRKRFEASQAGLLIQRDTSIHFWVPQAKKAWRLIVDLDDHSRKITGALFSEHDDVLSNMLVSWETVSTHGIPGAYYTDNNPIYNPLNKKPKIGMHYFYRLRSGEEQETVSQWKRAVQELGISCIHATPYQPQGKGKIERLFRFMQDRLVNEMITAKVATIQEANAALKRWVTWYNEHHAHSITKQIPQERYVKNNAFGKLPQGVDLGQIFCLKFQRTVQADNTFQHEGTTYQIPKNAYRISYARAKIDVRVDLGGQLRALYKGQEIGCFTLKTAKSSPLECRGEDILALHL